MQNIQFLGCIKRLAQIIICNIFCEAGPPGQNIANISLMSDRDKVKNKHFVSFVV